MVPLAIIYATSLAHVVMTRSPRVFPGASVLPFRVLDDRPSESTRHLLLVVASLMVVAMTLIKYQAIAFALPLFVLLWMELRAETRGRFALTLGISLVGVLTIVSGLMALENRSEYDDLFPISRGIRNGYWGTYQLVFNLNPENRGNLALRDIYADGLPFSLIREIEGTLDEYPAQRAAFEQAISVMLDEAGMDKGTEQLRSTLGAISGGRFDDIGSIVTAIQTSSTDNIEATIHRNSISTTHGIDQYVAGYNGGQRIEPVLTSAMFHSLFGTPTRSMIGWAGPMMVLALIASIALSNGIRLFATAGLMGAMAVFGVVGVLLADNYRYVIVAHMYLAPLATLSAVVLGHRAVSLASRRFGIKDPSRTIPETSRH